VNDDEAKRPGREYTRKMGRREADTADSLIDELLELQGPILARVALDPIVRDAVMQLRGMFGKKERPRHLRFTTRLVRESDMVALRASIDAAIEGGGQDDATRLAERFRDKIAAEGASAIEAFVEDHPSVDRSALRNAFLRLEKAKTDSEKSRAKRSILEVVRDAIRAESAARED